MDVKLEDRPIEQVRDETVDRLIYNYSRQVISAEAFEHRLDKAMQSDDAYEIVALVEDLPLKTDNQYQSEKESQFTPNYSHHISDEEVKLRSILGSNERSGKWLVPKEITVVDVLGSTTLDFTDAIFQHQNVTININCVLGTDTIYIPENVNVVSKIYSVMSSVENKSPSVANRQAPTITIKGKVVMGTVEVEVKRSTKEKLLGFAESLKSLFSEPK
ncbi:LiaF domain-containing protein [Thalassotalea crassostreae]|uniref:LiaF domain-containing protein n=1 Tax=Thalassotalea crassostreae TaxID=1763536 RepID=UPI000838B97C|nr:LiaF domain-containing protein [Thalassotalea crassostreae]